MSRFSPLLPVFLYALYLMLRMCMFCGWPPRLLCSQLKLAQTFEEKNGKQRLHLTLKLRNRRVTRDSLKASGIQFSSSNPFQELRTAPLPPPAVEKLQ